MPVEESQQLQQLRTRAQLGRIWGNLCSHSVRPQLLHPRLLRPDAQASLLDKQVVPTAPNCRCHWR
jgi:hypothetical protein